MSPFVLVPPPPPPPPAATAAATGWPTPPRRSPDTAVSTILVTMEWFRSWSSSSEYQSVSESTADEVVVTIDQPPQRSGLTAGLDKVKDMLGIAPDVPPAEKTFADEFDDMMTLTRTQRLYGFAFTFVVGWLINLMSLFAVPQIVLHPQKFALLYTFGNVISLCSTAFLWGPCEQIKDMFKPVRAGATIVYLATMVITLFTAFELRMLVPTIISIGIQMCAMVWYCASYIPYGQDVITSCMGTCCSAVFR